MQRLGWLMSTASADRPDALVPYLAHRIDGEGRPALMIEHFAGVLNTMKAFKEDGLVVG